MVAQGTRIGKSFCPRSGRWYVTHVTPYLNRLDSQLFEFPVARVFLENSAQVETSLNFCQTEKARLLVARVACDRMDIIREMEGKNFELMETRVCLTRSLFRLNPSTNFDLKLRPMDPGENDLVAQMAARSFAGRKTHYHADLRLDPEKCAEIYGQWARLCSHSLLPNERTLVAEKNGRAVGFLCLRFSSRKVVEGILAGVDSLTAKSELGVLAALVRYAMIYSAEAGAIRALTWTQITNRPMLHVCARLGWGVTQSEYTYHRWF